MRTKITKKQVEHSRAFRCEVRGGWAWAGLRRQVRWIPPAYWRLLQPVSSFGVVSFDIEPEIDDMIRIFVFSVLTLLAAGAAGAENQPSIPCKIKGFKTFCKYWDSCTKAPANSVTSNGRCLYSRMGTLNPDASLRDQNMSGSYSKVTFVSGPDTVAKLAEWHCTPGSLGSRVPRRSPCALA